MKIKDWAPERRFSFLVHLVAFLLPALGAVAAALDMWHYIFQSWFLAVPLVLSIEGVAALGFWLHLRGTQSPFVIARHFIPVLSIPALSFALWSYLDSIGQPASVSYGVTAFIIAVFGSLFVASIRKLESLRIDPLEAAREKVNAEVTALVQPLEEHLVRTVEVRRATERMRELEGTPQAAVNPFTVDDARAMFEDFVRAYPPALPAPVDDSNTRRLEALLDRALAALDTRAKANIIDLHDHRPVIAPKVVPASGAVMTCEVCGITQMDATQKGIAGRAKWQHHFDGKYACKNCRDAATIA